MGGTNRAGGKPGLELGRSQEQEKAERGVFQAPNLGAAQRERSSPLIPGLQGRKLVRTEVRTFSLSPLPQIKGAPAPLTFLERKGSVRLHPTHWCQMGSPGRLL